METRRRSTIALVVAALAAGFGAGYALDPAAVTAKQPDPPGLAHRVERLEAVVTQLGAKIGCIQTVGTFDVIFDGCNVHIRNGSGDTETANGLGNLIIGYNERYENDRPHVVRSGSHNLVVGPRHEYTGVGGFVAGQENTVSSKFASIAGGTDNVADNIGAAISGGFANRASGQFSTVSGGEANVATSSFQLVP
jgi:hypothetical protein